MVRARVVVGWRLSVSKVWVAVAAAFLGVVW